MNKDRLTIGEGPVLETLTGPDGHTIRICDPGFIESLDAAPEHAMNETIDRYTLAQLMDIAATALHGALRPEKLQESIEDVLFSLTRILHPSLTICLQGQGLARVREAMSAETETEENHGQEN